MPKPLDPRYYRDASIAGDHRLSVLGFTFDPATSTFDFSAVPGFDLSRLRAIWRAPLPGAAWQYGRFLYARPLPTAFGLAAVDGVPVSGPPTVGKVLKVSVDTSAMSASDDIVAFYDA